VLGKINDALTDKRPYHDMADGHGDDR